MKPILIALCLTTMLPAARAGQSAAPAVVLKQKSTFEATAARNPFWPIGWVKPNPINPGATAAVPAILPESFSLTSVTMGSGPRFAILNGKVMQEGQQFGLQLGSKVYQVTVQSVEDGQVVLAYEGGEVVVPLRRR